MLCELYLLILFLKLIGDQLDFFGSKIWSLFEYFKNINSTAYEENTDDVDVIIMVMVSSNIFHYKLHTLT